MGADAKSNLKGFDKMQKVTVNKERCKGCGLCVNACPKKVLELSETELNAKGYHPAVVKNPDDCISCAMCATTCPDVALKVER